MIENFYNGILIPIENFGSNDSINYQILSKQVQEREKELFGFYLSNYPTTSYKAKFKVINLNEIERFFNKTVDVIILVDRIKEIKTR